MSSIPSFQEGSIESLAKILEVWPETPILPKPSFS